MRILPVLAVSLAVATLGDAMAQDRSTDLGEFKTEATPASEAAIRAALDWLARHQRTDGTWSADGVSDRCGHAECDRTLAAEADLGTTALATLSYLGHGYTHRGSAAPRKAPYRNTIRAAITALLAEQRDDGFVGKPEAANARLANAHVALTLVDAYGMTCDKRMREPACRAVTRLVALQDSSGGWKRDAASEKCDPVLTSACALALRSAKTSEIPFDEAAFERAVAWTSRELGGAAPPVADARTAHLLSAAISSRWDGASLNADERFQRAVGTLGAMLPAWTQSTSSADVWTWLVSAPAIFQKGGEPWRAWWTAFAAAAPKRQCTDAARCDRGSWAPLGAPAPFAGRAATTALFALALETPYRYGRLPGLK